MVNHGCIISSISMVHNSTGILVQFSLDKNRRIKNLFNFLEENSYLLNRDGIDKYLMHIDKSDWIYSTKNEAFSIVRRFSEYYFDGKYVPYHPYNQFTEP
ncbi:MAG: hypothetical protein MSH53_05985, partial [Solobacterium sp.]|nr:hypothetical protein [Solobacterium sp.]